MITVLLIRHAESVANTKQHLVGGRSANTPLSPVGIEQAKKLGDLIRARNEYPTKIFSSPALRATETARLSLASITNSPPVNVSEEIHEMSQGAFENLPREMVYTAKIKERIDREGKDFSLPDVNAESMNDVARRIDLFLKKVVTDSQSGDTVHIYTHGIAICCYIGLIQNLTQQQVFELTRSLPNASLTVLRFKTPEVAPTLAVFGQTE